MCGCGKRRDCVSLIPFRPPQIICFTPSLKCFSSDSENCPHVGIGSQLQFPHLLRAVLVLLTLLFFSLVPSSYWVLHGPIYSFPLVRCSCPLSAGVLCALLCPKVCSWCNCGERCTPCSLTPLPSCSHLKIIIFISWCYTHVLNLGLWGLLHSFCPPGKATQS